MRTQVWSIALSRELYIINIVAFCLLMDGKYTLSVWPHSRSSCHGGLAISSHQSINIDVFKVCAQTWNMCVYKYWTVVQLRLPPPNTCMSVGGGRTAHVPLAHSMFCGDTRSTRFSNPICCGPGARLHVLCVCTFVCEWASALKSC